MKAQYVIAWWRGGDNGHWFPTCYRFDSWQAAQEKIREFSIDGHDYRVFDDTHGLPETRNANERID